MAPDGPGSTPPPLPRSSILGRAPVQARTPAALGIDPANVFAYTWVSNTWFFRIYILCFPGCGLVFGKRWAQERAQRPRLEKRYINQRRLTRESAYTWCFFSAGRKSRIFGVWAAPAAPQTIPKGGGLRPPPSGLLLGGRRGRPNPNNRRFLAGPQTINQQPNV